MRNNLVNKNVLTVNNQNQYLMSAPEGFIPYSEK